VRSNKYIQNTFLVYVKDGDTITAIRVIACKDDRWLLAGGKVAAKSQPTALRNFKFAK
jgi:hypothetical protein